MNDPRRAPTPRRLSGDHGSALVEAALITPMLLYVILGIIEYALVYRDFLTMTDSVADAARMGSIMGNKLVTPAVGAVQSGDYQVVKTLRDNLGGLRAESIKQIVIFKGDANGVGDPLDQITSQCKTATSSVSGKCNVYDPYTAFLQIQQDNGPYFQCAGSNPACGWNPVTRKDGTGGSVTYAVIDNIGVYMKMERPYLTGLFGSSLSLEAAAVQRLEPGFLDT
jgi:hypothetical protein